MNRYFCEFLNILILRIRSKNISLFSCYNVIDQDFDLKLFKCLLYSAIIFLIYFSLRELHIYVNVQQKTDNYFKNGKMFISYGQIILSFFFVFLYYKILRLQFFFFFNIILQLLNLYKLYDFSLHIFCTCYYTRIL